MTLLDYLIIAAYMAGIVAVGLASRGKDESAEDYFAAGGRLGGPFATIIIGLSITATYFSGLSFVSVPSIFISDGPKVMLILLTLPLTLWVVNRWFIPRYLAFGSLHPYEIITRHIGRRAHKVTSALFVLLRMGWMAALLYAPTILLVTTMQLDERWVWPLILMIGLSSTLYTVLGGLQSVLITDAVQMLIVIGSLIFAVGCGLSQIPLEPGLWMSHLSEQGKLSPPSFSLDLTERFTVWGILLGITVGNLATYIGDQMSLQRYIASGNVEEARSSFRVNIYGSAITLALLFALGFVIILWQAMKGGAAGLGADHVFPQYVATMLPPGVRGLIVAAILAATMDSIASGINSLAGAITIDFVQPSFSKMDGQTLVTVGKWVSLGIGVGATLCAGFVSGMGSIYDISQTILGVFLGPIFGVVMLATLKTRVNETRVLAGIVIGIAAGLGVAFSPIQSIWTTAFGFAATFLVGYPYGAYGAREKIGSSVPLEEEAMPS